MQDTVKTNGRLRHIGPYLKQRHKVTFYLATIKKNVSCIAVFQISISRQGVVQRRGAKTTQKARSRGRSLLSRPFACICIYNVISVVRQKIGLLIKLFVVVV